MRRSACATCCHRQTPTATHTQTGARTHMQQTVGRWQHVAEELGFSQLKKKEYILLKLISFASLLHIYFFYLFFFKFSHKLYDSSFHNISQSYTMLNSYSKSYFFLPVHSRKHTWKKCIQNQHTPAGTLEATVRSPGRFELVCGGFCLSRSLN